MGVLMACIYTLSNNVPEECMILEQSVVYDTGECVDTHLVISMRMHQKAPHLDYGGVGEEGVHFHRRQSHADTGRYEKYILSVE